MKKRFLTLLLALALLCSLTLPAAALQMQPVSEQSSSALSTTGSARRSQLQLPIFFLFLSVCFMPPV